MRLCAGRRSLSRWSQVLGNRSQSDLDDFQWFWDYCRKWKFKICSMSSGQLHVYVSVLKCLNLVINFDQIWPHCRGRGQAVLIIIATLWMASNPETPLPRPHPSPPTLHITITQKYRLVALPAVHRSPMLFSSQDDDFYTKRSLWNDRRRNFLVGLRWI